MGCLFYAAGHTRPAYTMHDEDMERQLTEADLARAVTLKLSETDTMWLIDMPSICVMNESDEALDIIRQNSRYTAVCRHGTVRPTSTGGVAWSLRLSVITRAMRHWTSSARTHDTPRYVGTVLLSAYPASRCNMEILPQKPEVEIWRPKNI